jgi:hypothetical protein
MKLADLKSYSTGHLNRRLQQKYGFGIKTTNLSESRARQLLTKVEESIVAYKKSHGHLNSEKNSHYTELLLMRDGLTNWLRENGVKVGRVLREGELEQAQTKLAAKDLVDRIQKMVEEVSSMLNEDLPPLTDSMRDQLGGDQAATFNSTVNQTLSTLLDAAKQTRQAIDDAARMAAGEQAAPMAMPGGAAGAEMPAAPGADLGAEEPAGDEQAAADAAAGGAAELGREAR